MTTADVLQIKARSAKRLLRELGHLDADDMVEIALAIGFILLVSRVFPGRLCNCRWRYLC